MTAENESTQENEKTEPVTESEQPTTKGPGEILQEAREAKGLSQREVADQLRLRKQIIELLETDDYATFSTPTFIKGYLRAYARLLDIDEAALFKAYKAKGFQEVESSQMQSFSRRKTHQKNDSRLMLITYAVIIIVVALVVWWWQEPDLGFDEAPAAQESMSEQSPEATQSDTNSLGQIEISNQPVKPQIQPDEEAAILESEVGSEDTNVTVESAQGDASDNLSESRDDAGQLATSEAEPEPSLTESEPVVEEPTTASVDTEATEPEVASEPPAAVNSGLIVEFSEECWVKIDDATGETQAVGVKAAGYEMPVPGEAPFSVTLCKPEAATLSFNGNAVDMSQFRNGRVARFTVPLSEQ